MGIYLISRKPKDRDRRHTGVTGWLRAFQAHADLGHRRARTLNCALPGVQYVYFLGGIG